MHIFISMLTLKAWKSEDDLSKESAGRQELQFYAKEYFKEISDCLSEMPREFALIFKTRDCLMALNQRL